MIRKWQIRILCKQPTLITDNEILFKENHMEVLERCMTIVARTSYMVNGPNREVLWSIEIWDTHKRTWAVWTQGRSRVRDRPLSGTPLQGRKGMFPPALD